MDEQQQAPMPPVMAQSFTQLPEWMYDRGPFRP